MNTHPSTDGPKVTERPRVWIGHVAVSARDVPASVAFYETLGMRAVAHAPGLAVLELRGGTHLVVQQATGGRGRGIGFDLMVDDLADAHAGWAREGLEVSEIRHGSIHDQFVVTDPDGNHITVNSSHVVGTV
jgi:catechol 2,3-dioxygenase-like lactoylglutathione lyase family enzyme